MVGALQNQYGVGRAFDGATAVSGAWERDAAAGFVEELFAAHHGEIYAYLIRMLRDPELAADLTQDAFLKAYQKLDQFQGNSKFSTWLVRIAVNEEYSSLDAFLRAPPSCLNPGGRVAILTFHSGEDRRVKKSFAAGLRCGFYAEISDNVIRPSSEERNANPRSASAKLRWARRT